MTVRAASLARPAWALLAAAAFAGCGPAPEPEFVFSDRTNALDNGAARGIQAAIVENFGSPLHSVAWLKMPVDWGGLEGEVAGDSDAMSNVFKVKWAALKGSEKEGSEKEDASEKKAEELLEKTDLSGAGLEWITGPYVGAVDTRKDPRKKTETAATFHVLDYLPKEKQLYVNARMEEPVPAGSKFKIIGTTLQHGRRVYMQHCVHCHGVSGDGAGPTAQYLNPRPRDYRLGLFKFTSTASAPAKLPASRDDLHRIIKQGIPGTYMPSFLLMKDDEVDAVTEYIRWLSMRGELEDRLADYFKTDFERGVIADRVKKGEKRDALYADFPAELDARVNSISNTVARNWNRAEEAASLINPKSPRGDPSAESIKRGRELYLSNTTKCAACHGPTGHGDGPQTTDFQKKKDGSEYSVPGLHDDWGNLIKPRDLNSGIYRGGRRPVDIYRRIRAGIKGTPMPEFGTLTEEQVWDLVNYVLSVPYGGKAPPLAPAEKDSAAGKEKMAAKDE